MRGIIIVVEGDTEEEFIKKTLSRYLWKYNIHDVRPIKATTSRGFKGGVVNYQKFKNKVLYGNLIIEEHGIDQILKKCPRFNQWVSILIKHMKGE